MPRKALSTMITPLAARIILLISVLAIYWPTVMFDHLDWDDQITLFDNPAFHPPTFGTIARYWQTPHMALYVPVTYTVWTVVGFFSYVDGRLYPLGFRLLSLALHAATSILVFEVIRRVQRISPYVALLAAMFFTVHPVQVESVSWISGGKDLLAGFLSIACVLLALMACQQGKTSWVLYAALLGVLAMLSKPAAVTLPLIVLAAGLALDPSKRKRIFWVAVLLGLLALPVVFVAHRVQPAIEEPDIFWWQRGLVAAFSLSFYGLQLLWPARLAVSYGWDLPAVLALRAPPLTLILPAAVAAISLLLWRRTPLLLCAVGIFAAALLPVLGFVPFEFQYQSTVADHYLYTAMLGLSIAASCVLAKAPKAILPATVILLCLGARSYAQVWVWQNNVTLFSHVLSADPNNFAANRAMAMIAVANKQPAAAAACFERVLRTHPNDQTSLRNYANLDLSYGHLAEAVQLYAKAAASGDRTAAMFNNWGIADARLGNVSAAMDHFTVASQIDPNSADAWANQGALEARSGDPVAAERLFRKALTINPDQRQALNGLKRPPSSN